MARQHVVNLQGEVIQANSMSDLEIMGLIYNVQRTTSLPYETKKSLKQVLFENKDKSLERQEIIVKGFFSQLGYTVNSITQVYDTDLQVNLSLNANQQISLII